MAIIAVCNYDCLEANIFALILDFVCTWILLSKWAELTVLISSYCLTTVKRRDRLQSVIYIELQGCLIHWCGNDMFALRWQLILVMQKMRQPLVVCLNKHEEDVTDFFLQQKERILSNSAICQKKPFYTYTTQVHGLCIKMIYLSIKMNN